jgi:excisionase family DNA binding protein
MAATYTVKQVAEILGYSTNSIYTFLKEKRIEGVRVGKGRFRIPQSELNRLLLVAKGQSAAVARPENVLLPDSGIITPHEPASPFSLLLFGKTHTVAANIFDWFIGVSSIVLGVAMYLFNQTFDVIRIPSVGLVMPAVRILLIGGGVGILLTNFVYDSHRTWHRVFHGILALAGISMTILLLITRDIDAVGIYGTLTLVIVLTMFVRLGRVVPFVLYLSLLAVVAPVIAFMAPEDFHVAAFASALGVTPFVTGIGLSGLSAVFILLIWLGLYWKKALYWFCSYAAAVVYLALAFWFVHDQFWSRAFFFMIIGLTCTYLPSWEDLSQTRNKKAHTLAIGVFGAIMAVILAGIAVVSITQLNVISTVQQENIQKADFARTMLETDIQSVKSTVTTSSVNSDLIAAVQEKNEAKLTDLSRIIFESSDSIRRLVILDKDGKGLFLYPLGTFDRTDLSFRNYFIQARDTGKLYVSDIFEALADNSHRKVVTISAPLFTPSKDFVGVLTASLNLDAVSARLQKIAVADRGEYIVVLDSHGKRIMHPVSSFLGTDTEPNDPTLLGLQGKTGVEEGYTYNGVHSLIAYTPIDSSLHWAIALKAPYNNVYALSSAANVVVAGLVIGCIAVAALIFQLSYSFRYKPENGGGSP